MINTTGMKRLIPGICLAMLFTLTMSQDFEVNLWPDKVADANSDDRERREYSDILLISNVQVPSVAVFLPAQRHATGQAVLICPGGGYNVLAYDWEGVDIARWFASRGIAAIVLKYRLPGSKAIPLRYEAPLQDAQRALRLIRFNADHWNIDVNKIGVIGFSAGGHLASTLGTRYDYNTLDPVDAIDEVSARPDFMVLVYPVISFREQYSHTGSRDALLGEDADSSLIDFYSNELHVSSGTPPAFLVHSGDDSVVPVENSLNFYQALINEGIPAEMHIFPEGGHGYSLAIGRGYLQTWTDRLYDWLKDIDIVEFSE
jgi:acetyl esterase/lipase